MNIDSYTNLFCLIGNPISKSLSPYIHNTNFKYNDINAVYLSFKVENLEQAILGIKSLSIKGFNVTLPYKQEIIKYLDNIDQIAEKIGAINTVKNINGKLIGFNTDGLGFMKSLKDRHIQLKNKNILIIGAGGASRAISFTIANESIKSLTIVNRNKKRALSLIKDIKSKYKNLDLSFLEKQDIKDNYDIIINTTSVGMYPNEKEKPLDTSLFSDKTIIYDIIYKPKETLFLKQAKEEGKTTINGLDMLVNQAILSERIWISENLKIYPFIFK
ncbi:shikimate dehydrogenase [Senegalia massiliensis]|uniref:Shikimate dehydrogenase (NADP(+)) n=1 Tax=Senegalia massiliensis TaxID=1720316 RepID=A0A845QXF6_9CLOT|nr:shikimate dehydrogenase [Senegalia massiliensis]NBI06674.1 shikimate dehydrogenase [Senegalia massiliensis]